MTGGKATRREGYRGANRGQVDPRPPCPSGQASNPLLCKAISPDCASRLCEYRP